MVTALTVSLGFFFHFLDFNTRTANDLVVSNPEMALQARWQEQSSIAIKANYIHIR